MKEERERKEKGERRRGMGKVVRMENRKGGDIREVVFF